MDLILTNRATAKLVVTSKGKVKLKSNTKDKATHLYFEIPFTRLKYEKEITNCLKTSNLKNIPEINISSVFTAYNKRKHHILQTI